MFSLDVLAGSPIRLTATARAGSLAVHRWRVRVIPTAADQILSEEARISYGSQIGGDDREQHIEIPAQKVDCRFEVAASRRDGAAWREERAAAALTDTPDLFELGFGASTRSGERDFLLSFRWGPKAGHDHQNG